MSHPPVLIEDWLPIEAIGVESRRERGYGTPFPAPNRLHVWWARRPLLISRAAILGAVLPTWSNNWPDNLQEKFRKKEDYVKWVENLFGIRGDPIEARKRLEWARTRDITLKGGPYGYPRAFSINPDAEDIETMDDLLGYTWGNPSLSILDPFAGGGAIPFESLRYGFPTIVNDLNPVASVVLTATLEYPSQFGALLANDIRIWGKKWATKVGNKLRPYFPKQLDESIFAYIWARTIACPTTGKPVPLSPNWWLSTGKNPVAIRLIAEDDMDKPKFEIVTHEAAKSSNPNSGTISRGVGRSPWTGETIDKEYIKTETLAGRMGQILCAVVVKHSGSGFAFRVPTSEDIDAAQRAEEQVMQSKTRWIAQNLIPTEAIQEGNKTSELLRYGMKNWADLFSPRQLLTMVTSVEVLKEIEDEMYSQLSSTRAKAVTTYLAMALNKCPNYNSRLSVWHPYRTSVANTFNRHDFGFAWSHGEFDSADSLLPWAVNQVVDAYEELAELLNPTQTSLIQRQRESVDSLQIHQGSATNLSYIPNNSIHNITVDPPYYDNVMYAELSDFFYVWLKRSVGHLFPEFFTDELTNKDDEAVANPARFADMGRKKKDLAEQDYERKMAAAFREMHRVLHPHGVLTVMFTHKRVEAWDTLASALIGAGFTIKASWPVHTESEHSLHQAQKNAAASTILLVCRKRDKTDDEPVWWDDLQGRVRELARRKAAEYAAQGISGVDLYISTFGPTLSLISENWPVLTSEIDPKTNQPRPLRPEVALDLARVEVIRLRKEGLLAGRDVQFDPVTDWYLMAWDAFKAEQFPYDEARKLAIALGLELDAYLMKTKRLVAKKGQYVVLQKPGQRRKRGMVDPDATVFEHWIDALHTAMLIYTEDGAGACDVFLLNRGLKRDSTFRAGLQALINAIPRTQVKGAFVRPEADILDKIRLAFYADELTVPVEEEPELPQAEQLGLGLD